MSIFETIPARHRKQRIPSEHEDQVALIQWFDMQYPALRGRLAACPNGGKRNAIVAAKLKAEGVRAGYPDLNLLTPRHGFAGLFIELKREKGGALQSDQAEWLDWLNEQGFMAVVCRGFDAAQKTIRDYLDATENYRGVSA
ncbi:VRR-NUC domain-containing protein [Pseudomonas sp. HS-18]|uniref:VRR-NUC domain-containing protein n=1 Tax=Pseudomonas sp. HS-18 TaxID=2879114 RepID=UPI001CF0D4EE|nr:VRR-NUC domain-containing protein [Pseudomonas sp. HS-18]UCL84514.1 VRR-NUC domain-containing protein [Pseudomonas sp. HS-18]